MPRRFDRRGWNRQFKWQPVRRGRWDPFPKDRLPFVDDYSIQNQLYVRSLPQSTPLQPRRPGPEMLTPFDPRWNNRIGIPDYPEWNYRVYGGLP